MPASILLPPRSLAIWLAALVSPTAYFVLLMVADRLQVSAPPEALVAGLFFGFPIAALVICGAVVWQSNLTTARKLGWMVATLAALSLEVFALLVIIAAATTAAIAY